MPHRRATDCPVALLFAMTCRNLPPARVIPGHCRFAARKASLQTLTPCKYLHVIANQCAHWCGNPRPPRGTWQVGSTSGKFVALFRICLRHCSLVCAAARRTDCHVAPLLAMTCSNLPPVRIIPGHCRGAAGKASLQPLTPARLQHVIANQCAHWCGNPFSQQGNLASWQYLWQIRSSCVFAGNSCFSFCPAAGDADCHVAPLLAMTVGGGPCTR